MPGSHSYGSKCPVCRDKVRAIRPNHAINSVVESYLEVRRIFWILNALGSLQVLITPCVQIHPDKKRPAEEMKAMDAKNKLTDMVMKKPRLLREGSDEEDNEEYDDEDDEEGGTSVDSGYAPSCGYRHTHSLTHKERERENCVQTYTRPVISIRACAIQAPLCIYPRPRVLVYAAPSPPRCRDEGLFVPRFPLFSFGFGVPFAPIRITCRQCRAPGPDGFMYVLSFLLLEHTHTHTHTNVTIHKSRKKEKERERDC